MKGLELSRLYWQAFGASLLEDIPHEVTWRLAFGLAGEGSECLGFDDERSHDHDFGPGFCVWVPDDLAPAYQERLQRRYDALPHEYLGYARVATELAGKRVGVFSFSEFVRKFSGMEHAPHTALDWLRIPEQGLVCLCSGEIFADGSGEFSALRRSFAFYYPEDVVKKKLAANLAVCAQAGQYNLGRCLGREELVAADAARAEFLRAAMACLHLLNRQYLPFYKWSFRSLQERCKIDPKLSGLLEHIACVPIAQVSLSEVELVCHVLACALRELGWIATQDDFLLVCAQELQSTLPADLKALPLSMGVSRL